MNTGNGNQNIYFNDEGNIAVVQPETTGAKSITLGDGGDLVIIEDTDAPVSIKAGTGNDKISNHGDNVTVDLSEAGTARILTSGGNITLNHYDHNTGAGIQGIYGNGDNEFTIGDGYISMLGSRITFDSDDDSAVVNIYDTDGGVTKTGFTYLDGGVVDLSKQSIGARLVSRNGNSTLLGGTGNDTVESGGDDYIDAGGGNNLINLNHNNTRDGATISASSGRNTIEGLYRNTDKFEVTSFNTVDFDYTDGNITIRDGSARTLIENASSSDGNGDYTTLILQTGIGDSLKAAITDNSTITTDNNEIVQAFFGNGAGVDFSDWDNDLNINLADSAGTYNGENLYFKGITQMKAGSGNTSLIASNSNSTLVSGSGNTSMLGGSGNDLLIGDKNKTANTEYFFTANGGRDTITNLSTSDKITTFDVDLTDIRTQDNDVIVDFGNNSLRLIDAVNMNVNFNTVVARIGASSVTYDSDANYYYATNANATLNVTSADADIWLSNREIFAAEFKTLDASAVNGDATLAGNDIDNVIISGSGNASLWGGVIGNDTLIGGSANDMFWYLRGGGNDVIMGASDGDTINFYDLSLADVTAAEITSSGVHITFEDGGSLNVNGANVNATFLIENVGYKANQTTSEWEFA